jgi:hypothetical protein
VVFGLLITPNQRRSHLKSIGGTQLVSFETRFGKVTHTVGRLYFTPNLAKRRKPAVYHFKILLRKNLLSSSAT